MVPKLSSVKIISAESLATSVPLIPIATPISARFNAGASLTPSPVIAVTLPLACSALIMSNLFFGVVRAKTWFVKAASWNSASLIWSNSAPVTTWISSAKPSFSPIALAVRGWSPVIIFTWTPAWFISFREAITSSRGGSMIPAIPSNCSPCSKIVSSMWSIETFW